MTNPDEDLLTTSEGVDEGSAATTAEGAVPPTADGQHADPEGVGVSNPLGDALGLSPDGPGERSAPPLDMESGESREARDARGTGQQLEAGEG